MSQNEVSIARELAQAGVPGRIKIGVITGGAWLHAAELQPYAQVVHYRGMPCLFCEIVAGRISARIVHQDDQLIAFHDVSPQAPSHALIIPRKHITSLLDLEPHDDALIGSLIRKARDLARHFGLEEKGFRLIFNCGQDAGYSVYHIHLHLVGGRTLGQLG
jgi:histidine triad (HIT) family protein